ncbi:hypothetical protein BT93_E2127 [Corymbia citriodora subsp. variegata]|nr:hypothetical protein BT93_E2127 [Corymbia citriodora subsp. variegata]
MSMARKATDNLPVNSCKRICDLPDDLLGRILGMLPMKDAVRTSVLSRRWEYLWTSLSDLIFDQYKCCDRMLFLNFVERALLLHDCSSIRVLSLRCPIDKDYAPHLDACLDAAIRRNVQDLKLQLYSLIEPSALPSSLFRCEMLTELDLCFLDALRVPSSVCFPSLKVLTLELVKFVDDVSAEKMFSGAALERLSLYKCNWADLGVLNISAPKLWSLSVTEARRGGDNSSNGHCKIVIHGPSLKYFYCSCGPLYDYTISGSSIPVKATVEEHYTPNAWSDPVDHWHRPLKGLLNVKFLTLKGLSFQGLHVDHRLVDGILDPSPPCFSSSLKRITVGAFFGTEAEMLALRILLGTAKALEEIVLYYPGDHSEHVYKYLLEDLAKLERPEHCRLRLVLLKY